VPGHHRLFGVRRDETDVEGGFTLIEMTVAIALTGFVFLALAASLMAAMRSLAIAKARTRGNEVATQGIEDLQRFGFSQLVLCSSPVNPPADLTDPVLVQGSCNNAPVEDSCVNTSGTAISYSYTCTRNNIVYNVSRYIAWSDDTHTSKRLAVFVNWNDAVGNHTVSQQSSVRAPGLASVIGLSPPVLSNPLVSGSTGNVTVNLNGSSQLTSDIALQISAQNLKTTDHVEGDFYRLDQYGNPVRESAFLNPNADASVWTGSIPVSAGYTFGPGTQYIVFNAIRAADGKETSFISTSIITFCGSSCAASNAPSFVANSMTFPSSVGIYPSGALKASFTISVQTLNTTATDSVNVSFMTQTGMLTIPLQVDTSHSCNLTSSGCYWTTTITTSSGYAFLGNTAMPMYFSIQQDKSTDPSSVDQGNTIAASSSPKTVTFS